MLNIFCECTALKKILISRGITSIDVDPFLRCSSLTVIIVDNENPVYDSRNNCNAIIETVKGI